MDRRLFLGGVLSGAAGGRALGADSAMTEEFQGVQPFDAPLAPMPRDAGEIATLVGLRPYREAGFVIRSETIGVKTIIHNYGHGGCGVTLSWGSARLALAEAASYSFSRAAVIGGGIVGLTTALSLTRAGIAVTVHADAFGPDTTSGAAAALWRPTTIFRPQSVDGLFLDRFRFAARVSHEIFRREAGDPARGVRWIRMFDLANAPATNETPEGADLYPGTALDAEAARRFGVAHAERYYALVIDMSRYLPALLRDFTAAGGRLARRRFASLADVAALDEGVIFNCAGYGARALFGDDSLVPVRGQITLVTGAPSIDYGYVHDGADGLLYMFPRANAIALGGTMNWGDERLSINEADRIRMLTGHVRIAARLGAITKGATRGRSQH